MRKGRGEPAKGAGESGTRERRERTSNFLGGGVRSMPKGWRGIPCARRWSKLN